MKQTIETHDPEAEAAFHKHVNDHLKRNYLSHLVHGMLAMTGFNLVNAPVFVPHFLFLSSGSPVVVGLVLAAQAFTASVSSFLGVIAVEHRKRILPLGYIFGWLTRFSVLGLSLTAFFVPAPYTLFVFAFFLGTLGTFSGLQNVLWNVLITKTIPVDRRGQLLGGRSFLGGITASIASLFGGYYFIQHDTLGNGYATTFLLAFVLTAVGFTVITFMREPDAVSVRQRTNVLNRLSHIPALLRAEPEFARYFYAQALAYCGLLALPFYVIFAGEVEALSGTQLGWLSFAFIGAQTVANLFWGFIADRFSFKSVLAPSLLIWACSTIVLATTSSFPFFVLSFICIGFGYSGFLLAAPSIVMEFGPRSELPLHVGLVNSSQAFIGGLAPIVGGVLAQTIGYRAVFIVAVVTKLLAAYVLFFFVADPRKIKTSTQFKHGAHLEP